jgi:drug/metabolite transporter (DMT)-like permease
MIVTFRTLILAMISGALLLAETMTTARVVGAVVITGGAALIALPGEPLTVRPRLRIRVGRASS